MFYKNFTFSRGVEDKIICYQTLSPGVVLTNVLIFFVIFSNNPLVSNDENASAGQCNVKQHRKGECRRKARTKKSATVRDEVVLSRCGIMLNKPT